MQKIVQTEMFPSLPKKEAKTREEVLESQVKLQFHEIKICQETIWYLCTEIQKLNEIIGEIYIRKTP